MAQKGNQYHQRPTPLWPRTHLAPIISKKVHEPENPDHLVQEQLLPNTQQDLEHCTTLTLTINFNGLSLAALRTFGFVHCVYMPVINGYFIVACVKCKRTVKLFSY